MSWAKSVAAARQTIADRCGEPIVAAVFVHRAPTTGSNGLARLVGTSDPASRLKTNNLLALTPTHLRLVALGGRSAMKPKDEIAAWPLGTVQILSNREHRASWMNSTMSHYEYDVHALLITAPDAELVVQVMADADWLDVDTELAAILAATPPAATST